MEHIWEKELQGILFGVWNIVPEIAFVADKEYTVQWPRASSVVGHHFGSQ